MITKRKTKLQRQIAAYVQSHKLSVGLGSKESACTIAAINLAISGTLTDSCPDCVCPVIHGWVIPIQDAIPDSVRNNGWRELVPYIAGTRNPKLVEKRKQILLDWMWGEVLPQLQPLAKKGGFGQEWKTMTTERTYAAAYAAAAAAAAAAADYAAAAADYAARSAAYAAAADAADYAARFAAVAAADYAADYAARFAAAADDAARSAAFWEKCNVAAVLERLILAKP